MRNRKIYILLYAFMAIAILSCNVGNNSPKIIPVQDFFKNPETSNYTISPSAKSIAFLKSVKNRQNIFIQDINSNVARQLTFETERGIEVFHWANENQLIFLRDNYGDENYHIFKVDKNTGVTKDLTPFKGVRAQILDQLENNSEEIIIGLNKRLASVFDVYRLNIQTGELKFVIENPGDITRWITDNNGKVRLAVSTDGVTQHILFRESEELPFRKILTTNFKETVYPSRFTPDNKGFFGGSNVGRDKMAVIRYDLEKNKEAEVLYENDSVDASLIYYSIKTKLLLMVGFNSWKLEFGFLNQEYKKIFSDLQKKLPGYEFSLVDMDRNEQYLIIRTYSDKSLGAYYLYTKSDKSLKKLGELSPWINEKDLSDMKPISYKNRHGETIHGYLILPKGSEGKQVPLIVNPHGGPWWRNRWGFSAEGQFFANRGYGVLYVNYHGSKGYGKTFWETGFKQMGLLMQEDINDGVNYLIKEKIVDSTKIGMYGFNFGGFHALSGITFNPELYKCAITYSGVYNLFNYIKDIPPYQKQFLTMNYEMIGNPELDADYFKKVSPVFHYENIKSPLLIIQGAKDPKLSATETNQFVSDLKRNGIDVTYILKGNEGHEFKIEENRIEIFTAMEGFLKKHLK